MTLRMPQYYLNHLNSFSCLLFFISITITQQESFIDYLYLLFPRNSNAFSTISAFYLSPQSQQTIPIMSWTWYCCDCQFGPHSVELHNTCIECGTMRCDDCSLEVNTSDYNTTHSCSHELPAYPSTPVQSCTGTSLSQIRTMAPITNNTTFTPGLSLAQGLSSGGHSGIKNYGATYMYFCCQCNDGPKVYNVQPRCVMCNHVACGHCIPAGK